MSRAALPQRREAWRRREVHGARRRGGRGPSRRISVKSAVPPHTVSVLKQLGRPHAKRIKLLLGFHTRHRRTHLTHASTVTGRSCSLGAVGRYLLPRYLPCTQHGTSASPDARRHLLALWIVTLDGTKSSHKVCQRARLVCVRNHPSTPPPSLAPYLLAPPSAERAPRPHVHRQTVRFGYSQSLWATRSVLRAPASPQTPHLWTERIHERIPQRVPTCSTRVRQNRPYPPYTFSFVAPKCDCSH